MIVIDPVGAGGGAVGKKFLTPEEIRPHSILSPFSPNREKTGTGVPSNDWIEGDNPESAECESQENGV